MSEFTPGPWEVDKNGCINGVFCLGGHDYDDYGYWDGPALLSASGRVRWGKEAEAHRERGVVANQALIAAAPDLYEALSELKDVVAAQQAAQIIGFNAPSEGRWQEVTGLVDAALAKARGET